VLGYIGLVSGLLTALRSELAERSPAGSRVTVIATGGYTHEPWLHEVPGIDAIEPDLTLRGIRLAHDAIRAAATPGAVAAPGADR
jgi:pantothenate kinase type III